MTGTFGDPIFGLFWFPIGNEALFVCLLMLCSE